MSITTQITRINTAKADVKEVVNQDFEKIQDETITYYPDKIAETIEEYKKYIPEKSYSGTEINVDDAVPLRVPMIPKANTYQATSILPEEYTQVDYIESSGTQYIDTGVLPTFNTEVELEFMSIAENMSGFIYGSRKANNDSTHTIIFFANASDYYPQFANDSSVIHLANTHPEFTQPNIKYKAKNGKKGFYINDVLLKQYTAQTELNSTHSMYIFALNENGSVERRMANARIYKFKIYENDILIRDYVPCYKNSDNEVGLYDIVNNVFYTNQGTGAFTYGAVVTVPNPEYPIPIEVVTGNNVIRHVGKDLLDLQNSSGSTITLRKLPMKLKAGTYTFSCDDNNVSISIRLSDTNKSDRKSERSGTNYVVDNRRYAVVTINFDAEYINISTSDTPAKNLQLEEGSVATEYEPYKEKAYQLNLGNIELCKIGDYEDELFKNVVGDENYNAELESGAWYEKNAIGIYEFTGNEAYQKSSTYSDSQYFCAFTKANILTNILVNGSMYCTRFGTIGSYTEILNKECIRCAGQAHIRILASRLKEASEQALKDLLKQWYDEGNPMKAYYSLNTPTYTKITDPTLISQLEALNKFKWFKGVNHIWTETENLEPVLEGKYKAVVESEVGE